MKYLKITNKGKVAPEAFSLIGASTKRNDDSKIGMFGSGNKYAISFLMRNSFKFRVFSNQEEMFFTTVQKEFANQLFDVICINKKETSLTTEMGPKWKLWQALRELYSNAVDEGLIEFGIVEGFMTKELNDDETTILIEANQEILDFYFDIDKYIAINRDVVYENYYGKIYKSSGKNCVVYRKGIRCMELEKPGIFDYDLNNIWLTEDRLASSSWQAPEEILKLLEKCDDVFVIRKFLNEIQDSKYYENCIDDSFISFSGTNFSSAWRQSVKNSKIAPKSMGGYLKDDERPSTYLLPNKLYKAMISFYGDDLKTQSFKTTNRGQAYVIVQENEMQKKMINDVKDFFKEVQFIIPYDIRVVDFKDKDVHGSVDDETILLGINAFENGKVWIANVIIEEYIHIKYDAADETRKFQDASIGELLSYMQKINSYLL